MDDGRFVQPLIERLLFYVGLQKTLAYTSICSYYRKERRWLIEQHALVDCAHADCFACRGIVPKHWQSTAQTVADLAALPPTLTHLTFGYAFN